MSHYGLAPLAFDADDSDSGVDYSTSPVPSPFTPACAPIHIPPQTIFPSIHRGVAADASAFWHYDQSALNDVAAWSHNAHPSPSYAIDSTVCPVDHNHTSALWWGNARSQYGDAPWLENARPACVDPLTNGAGAVSAAFLQLVESQGRGQGDKGFCLLRLLLRGGWLPQDELLDVVDWGRLRSLAADSVSHVFHCATWPVASTTTPRNSKLDYSPSSLTSDLSDLHGIDHFDQNVELLFSTDAKLDHSPSDYQLHGMPAISSAVQPLSSSCRSNGAPSPVSPSGAPEIAPTSSTIAPAMFTLPLETRVHSPEPSIDSELCHSPKHQQPASQTLHTSTVSAPKRRCLHCGVDHTTQWRTDPGSCGYLCNACGQHQWKHRKPRSLQAIMRERARANDKHTVTVSTPPINLPEKRGGEVIMRVPSKQARHD
ncbi:hypothetical protein MVEN_01748500 [Mycena venus]|uniref:GATA-type domain-containing protein n=1 Tax=Mycena venus TaxID=2733690 RepID=A0A8H6XMV5_9AGAR|nr:hypothetical protein MVEN_01748500 [Mycena venus]